MDHLLSMMGTINLNYFIIDWTLGYIINIVEIERKYKN